MKAMQEPGENHGKFDKGRAMEKSVTTGEKQLHSIEKR